jgi:DNA-binding MarR family transcriptional regulator
MTTRPDRTSHKAAASPMWHGIVTAAARRFHQICVARSTGVLGEAGITPLQYGAMLHLGRATGEPGIEQGELALRLNIDRNTASLVVEQLAKLGLLAREVSSTDRRARLLSLTAKGEAIYERVRPAFATANADVLAPLSPRERKQFMSLLVRVIEGNLDPQARPVRRHRRNGARPHAQP